MFISVYSDVRDALQKAVEYANFEYPEAEVILSHQNGEEPLDSYIALDIDSVVEEGQGSSSTLTDEDFNLMIQANYTIQATLNFIGNLSGDMSHDLLLHISRNPWVRERIESLKVGVLKVGAVTRIPQLRDGQWVEYHNLNVTFSYSAKYKQLVDVVEQVTGIATVVIGNQSSSDTFSVP